MSAEDKHIGFKKEFIDQVLKLSLLIIPSVFLILTILIHYNKGKIYLTNVDPEYFHLFNGLNLSIFNLAVDYIHHPGTTIQMIFAVSAHIVNFILPGDLVTDALNDPEVFIHAANIFMNLITAGSIFVLGFYLYRTTQNIFLALMLQLAPFASYHLLTISGRLVPEAILIAPLLLLMLCTILYTYDNKREQNTKKYVLAFAVLGGIGMAGKVLYFPFLLIPLFLFQNSRTRLRYILYTTIAFIVFAFPVFVHFGKSWEWYSGMLLHSGLWGTGENKMYDMNAAPSHLYQLFKIDKGFFVIYCLALFQLLIYGILYLRHKFRDLKYQLISLFAVLLSVCLSVFIITKHFSPHYFYPTLVFKLFMLFLMADLIRCSIRKRRIAHLIPILAFLVSITIVFQQKPLLSKALTKTKLKADTFAAREQALIGYNTIENPLIISSHYRGSPFIESAMVAGFLMSGSLKSTFIEQLTRKYPNTYFYYDWSDQFYFWDQFKDAVDIVDPSRPIYIFIGEGLEANLDVILNRIESGFPKYQLEVEVLQQFTNPSEYFYETRLTEKPL